MKSRVTNLNADLPIPSYLLHTLAPWVMVMSPGPSVFLSFNSLKVKLSISLNAYEHYTALIINCTLCFDYADT